MPDHILHPHKYTVYTLDEPITVGSGNAGADDRGVRGMTTVGGAEAAGSSMVWAAVCYWWRWGWLPCRWCLSGVLRCAESIPVGSSVRVSATSMHQAHHICPPGWLQAVQDVRAMSDAAVGPPPGEPAEERYVGAVGGGIEFRPKGRRVPPDLRRFKARSHRGLLLVVSPDCCCLPAAPAEFAAMQC